MNTVIRTVRVAPQRGLLANVAPSARLPVYLKLMLLASAAITLVVVGWTISVKQEKQLSNPFPDYAAIIGQPWSAVVALPFSCNPNNNGSPQSDYCTLAPAGGPFSLIAVTLSNAIVRRVEFMVREGALTVSDLALLWGRPNVRLYRQSAAFEWRRVGVRATGWTENGRFSYLIPLWSISFTTPSV